MSHRTLVIGKSLVMAALVASVHSARAQAPADALKPDTPPSLSEFVKAASERDAIAEQLAGATAQLAICRGQLAPTVYQQNLQEVENDRAKIVRDFEAANPGWTVDVKSLAISKKPTPEKKPDDKKGGDGGH